MANPPIIIGPFTSVPAPGSPIRSNWPQDISTYVTKMPRGTVARPVKGSAEGGLGQPEYAISGLTFTVPALAGATRNYRTQYGLNITASTQPGAASTLTIRLRQNNVSGAILGEVLRYWPVGQAGGAINYEGQFLPGGLAPGTVVVCTFVAGAGVYSIGSGSFLSVEDIGLGVY